MANKKFLSVDGGGTKILSVLFDEEYRLLGVGESGGINPNYLTMQQVKTHMQESIAQCLSGQLSNDFVIDTLWITMPGPADLYSKLLRQRCLVQTTVSLSEGECGIAAAGLREGMVVVCGTGSSLFYIHSGEQLRFSGGWGEPFGDEGSGFDIGCRAVRAAIAAIENRGAQTLLVTAICEQLQKPTLWESVMLLHTTPDRRKRIAGISKVVERCALCGDEISHRIFSEVGESIALQAEAFICRESLPRDITIVPTGGAWKGEPYLLRAFMKHLHGYHPNISIRQPHFDPVIGGAVLHAMGQDSMLSQEKLQLLRQNFPQFVYPL